MLPDVEEAVVERQGNGSRERLARVEEVDRGQDVDDPVRLRGQVVHLLGERTGRNGERVPIVGDAVVEEDPQAARVEATARAHEPCSRAGPRAARLYEIKRGAHDPVPMRKSRRAGARPS